MSPVTIPKFSPLSDLGPTWPLPHPNQLPLGRQEGPSLQGFISPILQGTQVGFHSPPPIIRYTGAQVSITIFSLYFWVPSLTISTKRDRNLKYIHKNICKFSLLLFVLSVMSDPLQPQGLQLAIYKTLFHNIPELFTGLDRSR